MARHVGALVPDPFTAEIASLHSRVVNLLLPDGLLVSLVKDPGDMTALAIEVPGLPNVDLASRVFTRSGGVIRSSSAYAVRLGSGRTFAGKPLRGRFSDGLGQTLRSEILRLSGSDGFASVLDNPQNAFARRAGAILADGEQGLSRLLGLGIGFTPSGDDFLTGYLMASDLWCASRGASGAQEGSSAQETSAAGLRESIGARLAETTAGGRTLLYLALRKSYPWYLLRFWRSIRVIDGDRRPGADLSEAVQCAARHGETSGLDALTGFAWFLLTRKG